MLLIVLNPTREEGQDYTRHAVSLSCEDEVVNLLTKIRDIFPLVMKIQKMYERDKMHR
jgi:hypothetical protein